MESRRPPFYLGIDVGGTNIKVGIVDDAGCSLAKRSVPTRPERGGAQGIETMAAAVSQVLDEAGLKVTDIRAAGVATPGTMDIHAGMLLNPPNLPGWIDFPIRDRLAERLAMPATLQNDANAAAYGEFWTGAARGVHSLVFWTLGTGVGCGIIVGNTIIEGAHSHGAECGHIILEMHGGRLLPGTGQYGTLEAYAGGKAIVQRCCEALDQGGESSLHAIRRSGEEITPLLIAEAAERDDPLALNLILETARYLGAGTTTLMHTIDPDMVLFGGAMTFGRDETELGRRFLQEIKEEVRQRAFAVPYARTTIAYARLGGDAGYIGAAGCARLKFGG